MVAAHQTARVKTDQRHAARMQRDGVGQTWTVRGRNHDWDNDVQSRRRLLISDDVCNTLIRKIVCAWVFAPFSLSSSIETSKMEKGSGEPQRFEIPEQSLERQNNEESVPIPVLKRIQEGKKTPTCVIVVGMAGSGKTTLMAQLQRSLEASRDSDGDNEEEETEDKEEKKIAAQNGSTDEDTTKRIGYCLNLDPATLLVPFGASIDIRDTVDYKQVMQQHHLGPNGAIMTCLNLFCTKFDQVISILDKRVDTVDYVLVDTPGQIEAFTWSASGSIITEALASSFPTVLVFCVDTVRCASSPNTFMSNMLYACSIMYRTGLPLVVVFNKIDVVPHDFCVEWMTDYDAFQEALDDMQASDESTGFYGSLTRSLSLVLDEFYRHLKYCGVSAATGTGMDEFWTVVDDAAKEFETDYLEDIKNRLELQRAKKAAKAKSSIARLKKDVAAGQEGR